MEPEDLNARAKSQRKKVAAVLAVVLAGFVIFTLFETIGLKRQLASSMDQLASAKQAYEKQITILQKQISALDSKVTAVSGESQQVALSVSEIERRQAVRQKSQEELVTSAVAEAAPSVVSIIATKDVPNVEVTYENPFGNDPYFQGMGIQVPVLRQKGVVSKKVSAGSGFIVTADGYVVTNRHVVEDQAASYTAILPNGSSKPVTVIYRDPNQDVAILRVSGSTFSPAELGDSSAAKVGQTVIAIGNALGEYSNSVSVGIISGLNRQIEASGGAATERLTGVIQTDAAINPGNSGGPLIDLNGKVIGVNVATVTGTNNISFSIPINSLRPAIQSVIGRNI